MGTFFENQWGSSGAGRTPLVIGLPGRPLTALRSGHVLVALPFYYGGQTRTSHWHWTWPLGYTFCHPRSVNGYFLSKVGGLRFIPKLPRVRAPAVHPGDGGKEEQDGDQDSFPL